MKGCSPLSTDEITRTLEALDGAYADRDRALFLLGLRTGLRISELLSIRVGQVWSQDQVLSRVYVERRAIKGKREGRSLPLHPEAAQALRLWLEKRIRHESSLDSNAPLFSSRKGNSELTRQAVGRILRQALSRAGVTGRKGTHVCRKTFAAKMYQTLGHDLLRTSRALGHRSILTTISYLSFNQNEIDAAILST